MKKELQNKIIAYGALILAPVLCFYLMEFMLRNPFEKMKFPLQLLNILFFELFTLFWFFAFKSVRIAVRITAAVSLIIGLITYFIVSFRGIPVQPWDIFSLKTAASVANNYEYRLTGKVVVLALAFLLIMVLCTFIKEKVRLQVFVRVLGTLACGVALVCATLYVQSPRAVKDFRIYDKLFTPLTMTYKDGTVVAFLLECQYLSVDKPQDYSDEAAEELLRQYADSNDTTQNPSNTDSNGTAQNPSNTDSNDTTQNPSNTDSNGTTQNPSNGEKTSDTPNIIVIMNEAFSDLSILGDYTTSEDEIPFVRGLMENGENTIAGFLDVSVLGGNTANTEFEYLTGDTMAFLPQGCIPYQQYVKSEKDSMASHLKELGYSTIAMHPYKATGWDRDKVYTRFGFDRFIALDEFQDAELIRKYVSDRADYDKLIRVFEEKEKDTPLFLFNVTMQNHSSYSDLFDNFSPYIQVGGVENTSLEQYLSLLSESDKAIENLVNYFDSCEEDTVIVFFGDHQPTDSVVSPIYKLNNESMSSLTEEEQRSRYQVPYFIHANFDIEERYNQRTSANFLGVNTLEAAGLPLSPYQAYLLDLQREYTSVSVMQTTTAEGVTESISDTRAALKDYQMLQYYHLFR